MKGRLVIWPVAMLCVALVFSCDDSKQTVKPGTLKNGVYTGSSVLNVAGNEYHGTSTVTLTVSGDNATGTVESEYPSPVGGQTGEFTAMSSGGGNYTVTLVTSSSTATGTAFVSEDNVLEGSVSGTRSDVPYEITFTVQGENSGGGGDDYVNVTIDSVTYAYNQNCRVYVNYTGVETSIQCDGNTYDIGDTTLTIGGLTTGTYTGYGYGKGVPLFNFDAGAAGSWQGYSIDDPETCSADSITLTVSSYSNGGVVAGNTSGTVRIGGDCGTVTNFSATFNVSNWIE